MKRKQDQAGFALPTIIIASIIMLIVLLSALTVTSSVQASLKQNYYERMARNVSESAVIYANFCLRKSNLTPTWSNASPLRPNTDCSGGSPCSNNANCFVNSTGNVKTTFEVSGATSIDGKEKVKVQGIVTIYGKDGGAVAREYRNTTYAILGGVLSAAQIVTGYHVNSDGVYYASITPSGVKTAGLNADGQLGIGSVDTQLKPVDFRLPDNVHAVDGFANGAGEGRAMYVLDSSGSVYAAGYNLLGQLGFGNASSRESIPKKVILPADEKVQYISALGTNTFYVTRSGNIYAAGGCGDGVLGTGYSIDGCSDVYTPARVALPPGVQATSKLVSDYRGAIVISRAGEVYGWGSNIWGQLADGTQESRATPIKIGAFGGTAPKAIDVAFDGITSYVVDASGQLWSAGSDLYGQLGDGGGPNGSSNGSLRQVNGIPGRVKKVVADQEFFIAMTDDGKVWGSGLNNSGQLGDSTTTNRSSPVQFQGLPSGVRAVDVYVSSIGYSYAGRYNNTVVVGSNGKVYTAGSNQFGQIGDGTTTQRLVGTEMSVINGTTIRAAKAQVARGTALVLTENGRVYTAGSNSHGQLGDGTTQDSTTPKANIYTNPTPPLIY